LNLLRPAGALGSRGIEVANAPVDAKWISGKVPGVRVGIVCRGM